MDEACKDHDLVYHRSRDSEVRRQADLKLADQAWERFKANDSSFGEKAAAWTVTNAMKLKAKTGGGCGFKGLLCKIKKSTKKGYTLVDNIKNALKVARRVFKKKRKNSVPRILPLPKVGGALPLIPIFAALSALGSIASGASSVLNAIGVTKTAKQKLDEERKRNVSSEGVRIGSGVYLKPYKKGYGLVIQSVSTGGGLKKKKSRRS